MEIFGFVISVWTAILIGLFFIAMVVGVTFDRHYQESPKWWVLAVALVTWVTWSWYHGANLLPWSDLWSSVPWIAVSEYLLIGLAYSVLEFFLEVRRSARFWKDTWENYREAWNNASGSVKRGVSRLDMPVNDDVQMQNEKLAATENGEGVVESFLKRYNRGFGRQNRIIGVTEGALPLSIEPKVDRQQLAEAIGCWTIFWPFYLVSLIIGDLLTEIFRILADLLVSLSGRFVKLAFKDVFKL